MPARPLGTVLLLAILALPAPGHDDGANVLLVIADDLGIEKLRPYANVVGLDPAEMPVTPTLEGLCTSGVLFETAWSNPTCSPTRATLLTGRYAFRTGVGSAVPFTEPLDDAEQCLPETFDELGLEVATSLFGKWHLTQDEGTAESWLAPNRQGFDDFAGTIKSSFPLGQSYFVWSKFTNGTPSLVFKYATSETVDDALTWIGEQEGSWFCTVSFHAPHQPFHEPPADLYSSSVPPTDPCLDPVPFFRSAIEALDTELGRLLAGIDPDVLARTTVVFLGDNGTPGAVLEAPIDQAHGKGKLFEAGVRVPLVVSGPSVEAPGTTCAGLVGVIDLHDTVLELLGAPPQEGNDSVSLVPYLVDPLQPSLRSFLFTEHFEPPAGGPTPPGSGEQPCELFLELEYGWAVRDAQYKLIRTDALVESLYDLSVDPYETDDLLVSDPKGAATLAAQAGLSAALDDVLGS